MYRTALIAAVFTLATAGSSLAQTRDASPGPGKVEASIIPGGGLFFTEGNDTRGAAFGNYDLGGSVTVNFNRYVGVEGEVSGALGVSQNLDVNGASLADTRTPHMLQYTGNVVAHLTSGPVVPYATAGVGGLSLFERADLGIPDTETFLTTNIGGGIKWYRGRFGLRGDYRFIIVRSQDDASVFFGQETRYGHRVYGGIIVNIAR
jgi:hypothetical protein